MYTLAYCYFASLSKMAVTTKRDMYDSESDLASGDPCGTTINYFNPILYTLWLGVVYGIMARQ